MSTHLPLFSQESPHPLLERDALNPEERRELLAGYVTRGRALQLEDDRGIVDSHRRRALNLAQFFTPGRVVKVLYQALGLADHHAWKGEFVAPKKGSLVDPAGCGNGRMFQFAPEGWTLAGTDVDPLATRAARLSFPGAEILDGSLLDFRAAKGQGFTLALINPPFNITLNSPTTLKLATAQWGVWGKSTSVPSHLAAVELALGMAEVVGAILPTSSLRGDDLKALGKALKASGKSLRLCLDLPRDAFKEEGTEWPCSIVIFAGWSHNGMDDIHCGNWEEVEEALVSLIEGHKTFQRSLEYGRENKGVLASWRVKPPATPPKKAKAEVARPDFPVIRVCLGGLAHKLILKPNGLVAKLAIEEARLWSGWTTSDGFSPQCKFDWACDLVRNGGRTVGMIEKVVKSLEAMGEVRVEVDPQVWAHARKADRRAQVEMSSFSQWVRVGDTWEERGRDTSGPSHPAFSLIQGRERAFGPRAEALVTGLKVKVWDKGARAHVERATKGFPIYAFSRADITRTLGCRAVIYSAKQGLAKTRFSIGAVLASGMSKAVWVLESRLVGEFKRELAKVGLLEHFHRIEKAEDLKTLKLFNVITYSRLWKPVLEGGRERRNWGPGKSFAAALAKRRLLVVVDEAHKCKAADSKQGIACRLLCHKAKRVVMMTGTVVQSYPRNILGLANAGWGDGSSEMPYGYRRPVEGGYYVESGRNNRRRNDLIRGVTQFVDEFVDILWYTPAFEQTASTGMKSREIPRLKDVPLWDSFVRPKVIRRVPEEPEVRASGVAIPEAVPEYCGLMPDPLHYGHYKLVLDHFAQIWKNRLKREKETGMSENNAACILPELDALRFASTVPIVEHRWAKEDPILQCTSKEPTAVMKEAMRRIAAWVEAGDRVVVGAEKPSALLWLADLLADLPRHVPGAEPVACTLALDADIDKRNVAIDRARDEGEVSVLLISIGKGKEGLNLPEFNKLLTLDYGWCPGDLDQFSCRILRPGQIGDVELVHLHHESMIDAYMQQLCLAKKDAINQAIDGQESEFNYEGWLDIRSFALQMLEREGYKFAAEQLLKERTGRSDAA